MDRLLFNYHEHFEYIDKHEKKIKEILENNTFLLAATHEKELEKDVQRCFNGHPLSRGGKGGAARNVTDFHRSCAVCCRKIATSDNTSCQGGCEFDICQECSICPKMHQLEVRYKRPWAYENIQCSRCLKDQSDYQVKCGILACDACSYYLCRKCSPRPFRVS